MKIFYSAWLVIIENLISIVQLIKEEVFKKKIIVQLINFSMTKKIVLQKFYFS